MSNAQQGESLSFAKQSLIALESMQAKLDASQAKLDASERLRTEPVAIVGMGCRFPGGISDPEGFWDLLSEGRNAISDFPFNRPRTEGADLKGGFLDDVQGFDANFFGISPREAVTMDPQQRLVLEVAWEALEHAGIPPDKIAGSQTGVYVGVTTHDYLQMQVQGDRSEIDSYFGTGTSPSLLSGRVSYFLGLHGPSITVDTACSSSLVTVHLACQALRAGECNLALAGGVNLLLSPELTVYFSKIAALAPDGQCKAFDASADGFVRSEGCGIVVLKRLSDALAGGDEILALIRGTAVNQDGRSNGLTAPNLAAQEAVIRKALSGAGVSGSAVEYVEAHGSGTPLGDPIEVRAISAALGANRPAGRKLWIGSVKANFGHTEAAAGIAGLMKVVLALRHGKIPAHLHFKVPNPHVSWEDVAASVASASFDWPAREEPRFAGVSSFGISGTNAHAVLSDAPPATRHADRQEPSDLDHLLTLSARSSEALRDLAHGYRALLSRKPDVQVYDLCSAAGLRRAHHTHRLAVVARSVTDIRDRLDAFVEDNRSEFLSTGQQPVGFRRRVVFVFPGHGSQWIGMGKVLLETEPEFRAAMEECDRAIRAEAGWSVMDELMACVDPGRLECVSVVQPLLFALEIALARLWRSWGVEPDAVVGHSMGEIAAACICGVLSVGDAARVICLRSQLLQLKSGEGGMAVVELSAEAAERAIAAYADRLSVAVCNGPRTTVIAGDKLALAGVVDALARQSVFCRPVKSDVAFHTPQLDSLLPAMRNGLGALQPGRASIPFYSTVRGRILNGTECDSRYWADNLREPVLFWGAVQQLSASGHDLFLEISPHPILLPAIEEGLRSSGRNALVVSSLRRDEDDRVQLLNALGKVYAAGCPVNWAKFYSAPPRPVALPNYPWQRERFWMEEPDRKLSFLSGSRDAPLLGRRLKSSLHSRTNFWEIGIDPASLSFLKDHALFGELVFPAAGFVEMALEAASELWGPGNCAVEDVAFLKFSIIPEETGLTVQIAVAEEMSGGAAFRVSSRVSADSDWRLHVTGRLARTPAERPAPPASPSPVRSPLAEVQARTPEEHYRRLRDCGLECGPSFRGLQSLACLDREVIASIRAPLEIAASLARFRIHPALLDAAFQAVTAALVLESGDAAAGAGVYVPTAMGSFRLFAPPQTSMAVHAKLSRWEGDTFSADITLASEDGQPLLEVIGLEARRIATGNQDIVSTDKTPSMYRIEWKRSAIEKDAPAKSGTWVLVHHGPDDLPDLASLLQQAGHRTVVVKPEEFSRGAASVQVSGEFCGVVYRGATAARHERDVQQAIESCCLSLLDIARSLTVQERPVATRLVLVTRGGQHVLASDAGSPAQAALWGLGRTLALEQPSLRSTLIDLDPVASSQDAQRLAAVLRNLDGEDQVALRGDDSYVARLALCGEEASWMQRSPQQPVAAGSRAYRLETKAAGVLDNLQLREMSRKDPDPGQVEIEVAASGINFLDVLGAMGARPDAGPSNPLRLGYECAGRVIRVGAGVHSVAIGDTVVAISPNCLASHVLVPETLVSRFPSDLSIEQAASIPVAYVTAWYALEHLARIQKGESVLIHSAAGGVGLAAVQIARRAGAEIFATAGTDEKRSYLRSLGIRHVMDSRTLAFSEQILRITDGRGVDIVLNSLTGEAVERGIAALATCGRFLEIGKKDIYEDRQIGLLAFRKNLSYFAIDLAWMAEGRPEVIGNTLREVFKHFEDKSLHAIPVNVFPISRATEAFHLMAQGRHTGRVVVTLGEDALVSVDADDRLSFQAGTYLITGGLGALGLRVAQWMADRGARSLVLLGRSEPSSSASETIATLRERGLNVIVERADVADESQLARVLQDIDMRLPELRGVVHAAGMVSDGAALDLDATRLRTVMDPKIQGTWNLHLQTQAKAIDFFLMFSSAASVLGSPGQANYAAANAFMDAVTHLRRSQGLPAQSINWGPWSEIGMAAQRDLGEKLEKKGIAGLTPAQGMVALERVMKRNDPQVALLTFNARAWSAAHPAHAGFDRRILSELADLGERKVVTEDFAAALHAAPDGTRRALLEGKLREAVAQVLRLPILRVDPAETFGSYGFDSLMALEFRNRLQSLFRVNLSATMVWNYPAIPALAGHIAQLLNLSLGAAEPASQVSGAVSENLGAFTESELVSLLDDELAHLGFSAAAERRV
jgi:acyl transferase domain-containing protein/acyl carrier protein